MRAIQARIFFVALATLAVEIALERILSVALTGGLSWLVLSACIFAYGIAGLIVAARVRIEPVRPWLVGFGISLLAFRPLMNSLNLRVQAAGPLLAFLNYSLLIGALGLIFLFSSLFLIDSFSRHSRAFSSFYGVDLIGAALGVLLGFAMIGPLNPGQVLNLMGALAFIVAATELGSRTKKTALLGSAIIVAALAFYLPPDAVEFKTHLVKFSAKNSRKLGSAEFVRWDPVSKIEVFPPIDGVRTVLYDGGSTQTSIYHFDGNFSLLRAQLPERLDEFWSPGTLAAHLLKEKSGAKVLLIGAAGGQELKAALVMGAKEIDATEIVATVLDLGLEKYRGANGELFHQPGVHVHNIEGRAFLIAHPEKKYDIIQLFSVLGSSAFGSRSPMKQEESLTVEALKEYLRQLEPDGLLQLNHVNAQRQLTTLARAWRELGLTDLRRHVVLIEDKNFTDVIPTLLIKREAWLTSDIKKLSQLFSIKNEVADHYAFLSDPLAPASFFAADFFGGQMTAFLSALPYDLSPVTDDRPFFQYLRKELWSDLPVHSSDLETAEIQRELRGPWVIGVLGLVLLFFVVGCVAAIAALPRLRQGAFSKWAPWIYFALVGCGFIVLEQSVIHRLVKIVGSTPVAFTVGLFAVLLSAGIGSLASTRILGASKKRALICLCVLVLTGACYQLSIVSFQNFAAAFAAGSGTGLGWAFALSVGYLFPLGFLLGLPFPIGIKMWASTPATAESSRATGAQLALAWAQNGIFTVLGSYFGCLAAIHAGFSFEAWSGIACYFFAATTLALASTTSSKL